MSKALLELVKAEFGPSVLHSHSQHGDDTVLVEPSVWFKLHQFLRDDPRVSADMLMDLTVVDYLGREPRFEIVTHVYSLGKGHRLRCKTAVGDEEAERVEVDSLTSLWGSANWMEREAYDMFGVQFLGHPDLRRILMYPEFEGHPLRKDYPAEKIQPLVPYREVPNTEKVAPFGVDEGMPFGRQSHELRRSEN